MAIIKFDNQKPEDRPEAEWNEYWKVWTWLTHVGLCVRDREMNGYDDSDFYMLVYNPDHTDDFDMFKEIMFATTRGWSYPAMGSAPDASPEVMKKYEDWKARMERRSRRYYQAKARKEQLSLQHKISQTAKVPYPKVINLAKTLIPDPDTIHRLHNGLVDLRIIASLFGQRVRNTFKLKLRQQVIEWMLEDAPRYETPLSPRQMSTLSRWMDPETYR